MKRLQVLTLVIVVGLSLECGPDTSGAPLWPCLRKAKARNPSAIPMHRDTDPLTLDPGRLEQPAITQEVSSKTDIETTYDGVADRTTVRLKPIKISGEKAQYHTLHLSPSFSYPGKSPVRPPIIDFELQTVVKGRLRSDLYVLFVIDGEKVFLSSNRWAVKQPVPGRVWMGERLVFRMPYETLKKMSGATKVQIKMDAVVFDVGEFALKSIRDFTDEINKSH